MRLPARHEPRDANVDRAPNTEAGFEGNRVRPTRAFLYLFEGEITPQDYARISLAEFEQRHPLRRKRRLWARLREAIAMERRHWSRSP